MALAAMIGPRMRYLSATHAVANMQKPAKASAILLLTREVRCLVVGVLTWRSNKTLRLTNGETHAAAQDLRQEVGKRIRDSRQTTEAHGETPDLEIKTGLQELDEVERLGGDIRSVGVDASDDEVNFTLVQEAPGLLGVGVGEGNQEAIPHDPDADGEDTFDDEDPAGNLR